MNALVQQADRVEIVASQGRDLTPMGMLERAVASGADIGVLSALMALHERWEQNQARKAFAAARAAAKAEIPVITKDRHVQYDTKSSDKVDYWHEDLASIARVVDPILGKHGLSYRFRTSSAANEPIIVTCVLEHAMGHFEENTLQGPRDDSGKKNSIQQIGSSLTYLQRYTLRAALGLAAARDDDGRGGSEGDGKDDGESNVISAEQLQKLRAAIKVVEGIGMTEAKVIQFAQKVVPEVEKLEAIPPVIFDKLLFAVEHYRGAKPATAEKDPASVEPKAKK